MLEFDMIASVEENKTYNIHRVSVSPKETHAYIVCNSASEKQGTLAIFDLLGRDQILNPNDRTNITKVVNFLML